MWKVTALTFTYEFLGRGGLSPFLLLEALAAGRALRSAGVMLAPADQLLRHVGILNIADVRVSVAHATTANTDVFDRIKVLQHRPFSFRRDIDL